MKRLLSILFVLFVSTGFSWGSAVWDDSSHEQLSAGNSSVLRLQKIRNYEFFLSNLYHMAVMMLKLFCLIAIPSRNNHFLNILHHG